MKFLVEGPVSDYMTNLKNKVSATYDYYMGKRTNKLGNLKDATAKEIYANKDLLKIVQMFNQADAPYSVQSDRTANKLLMQFRASETPRDLVDAFDEKRKGKYSKYIDSYKDGVVDLIFDADLSKVSDDPNIGGVSGERSDVGQGTSNVVNNYKTSVTKNQKESINESLIIVPDSKEASDIIDELGFNGSLDIISTKDGPAISGDNETLSQFIKEYNNQIGKFDLVIKEAFNPNQEQSGFVEIDSKTIYDMDGFITDYTMYRDVESGEYVFVYGDKEVYSPEDGEFDWSCDSEQEAREWFDSYQGFTPDTESSVDDTLNESISNGHKYTDVVAVDGKKVISTDVSSEHNSYHGTFVGYVHFELEDGSDKYYPIDLNGELVDDVNAWNFIKKQGLPKLEFKLDKSSSRNQIINRYTENGYVPIDQVANYVTELFDGELDDRYSCIASIIKDHKDEGKVSTEVIDQYVGGHNLIDKKLDESVEGELETRKQNYLKAKEDFETLGEKDNNDILSREEKMLIAKAEYEKVLGHPIDESLNEGLSPQKGDRVRMDHYSKLNNGQEGTVTGRIGELCSVTWDDGTKSKEIKGYLTVIERDGKYVAESKSLNENPAQIGNDPAPNTVSLVDLIKGAYEKGLFKNLKCIGRQNACQIDISGVDKDRLIGFFDSKKEFNREDHNEAGINSVEFISDQYDVEIFDSFIQIYKIPQNESIKKMSAEEFVKSLEESIEEDCSTSATQSSSVGQHKKGSIDIIPDVSSGEEPEKL